ncbi:ketohexokinase-like protein [Ophiobolus disseminans]|uniref:Ketohexokinase-like protein n=1 Tax=Ophiobolus disseminans TaxID=1469910 RepID=A0A6A6ZH68_9PLEO|nr:ketohexokinase-like protein [Ophiobolus disseminans]
MAPPQPKVRVVCVGAIYMDTIWTVPSFPKEDSKLRASHVERRRGGNVGNTLEVLSEIIEWATADHPSETVKIPETFLELVAALPEWNSVDKQEVSKSLPLVKIREGGMCRVGYQMAASSMIIHSLDTGSRTIISHNSNLPEMTTSDFFDALPKFHPNDTRRHWFHFEGRNPDVTCECIQRLRTSDVPGGLMISVECENPERRTIEYAAMHANVVFYSKQWAEGHGFTDPETFLMSLFGLQFTEKNVLLVCTWGEQGAVAVLFKPLTGHTEWARCSAWSPAPHSIAQVVDPIGAGDTFNAGMIFCLAHYPEHPLQHKLRFAVEIASRKVYQSGFKGLGKPMRMSNILLDPALSPWVKDVSGLGTWARRLVG